MRFSVLLPALLISVLTVQAATAQRRSGDQVREETLTTRDGVGLTVSYYPSSRGEQATPVLMLHDLKEQRAVYDAFARRLQTPGRNDEHDSFAVLAVDLRGHGGSTTQTAQSYPGRPGRSRQLEAMTLRKGDFQAMVMRDMEAVRKFLVTENDAGNLNLNRLAIIGTGLGASVGLNWAAVDWSMAPLATIKQGQDVKAMVLVSPRWKTNGLSIQNALRQQGVRSEVAMMLFYGGKSKRYAADGKRIYKQLERYHDTETEDREKLPTLVQFGPDTELQGTEWLKQAGPKAEDLMIRFLTQHAVEPDYEHIVRRSN